MISGDVFDRLCVLSQVHHNRDNMPFRGVIIGRLGNGERFIANVGDDPAVVIPQAIPTAT